MNKQERETASALYSAGQMAAEINMTGWPFKVEIVPEKFSGSPIKALEALTSVHAIITSSTFNKPSNGTCKPRTGNTALPYYELPFGTPENETLTAKEVSELTGLSTALVYSRSLNQHSNAPPFPVAYSLHQGVQSPKRWLRMDIELYRIDHGVVRKEAS
jgi:predicted DNA-binding transcriptional regulator AlpA